MRNNRIDVQKEADKKPINSTISVSKRDFFVLLILIISFSLASAWFYFQTNMLETTHISNWESYNSESHDYDGKVISKASIAKACSNDDDSECETVILIGGTLGNGTLKSFFTLISSQASLPNTVCFDSPGGLVYTAEALSQYIKVHSLNTCLAQRYLVNAGDNTWASTKHQTECSSSCPFALLSGNNTVAYGDKFTVAVHHPGQKPRSIKLFGMTIPLEEKKNTEYITDWHNGLYRIIADNPESHKSFFRRAMNTPYSAKKLDIINNTELRNFQFFDDWKS